MYLSNHISYTVFTGWQIYFNIVFYSVLCGDLVKLFDRSFVNVSQIDRACVQVHPAITAMLCLWQKKVVRPVSPWRYQTETKNPTETKKEKVEHVSGVKIFYGSQTGTAKV